MKPSLNFNDVMEIISKVELPKLFTTTSLSKTFSVSLSTITKSRRAGELKQVSRGTYTLPEVAYWLTKHPNFIARLFANQDNK